MENKTYGHFGNEIIMVKVELTKNKEINILYLIFINCKQRLYT